MKWLVGIFWGDFGCSFPYERLVKEFIGERLMLTVFITEAATVFTGSIAFPSSVFSVIIQHFLKGYIETRS